MLHSSIYSTSHVAMSIIVAYPQVVTRHSFTRREKKTARSCRGAANIYPTNARFQPQTPRNETKRSGSQIKSLELNIVPHPQPNTARSKKIFTVRVVTFRRKDVGCRRFCSHHGLPVTAAAESSQDSPEARSSFWVVLIEGIVLEVCIGEFLHQAKSLE